MYIIVLSYTADMSEIDQRLTDHGRWLATQYEQGHFLLSGRRNPRTGGVIIAKKMPREELDAILSTDPFATEHLAEYQVIEFFPTKTVPDLDFLAETISSDN